MAERIDPQTKRILDTCPNIDSTTELSLSNLSELRQAICSLTSRWYNIGISFGIPTSKLEEFRSKYRDPDRCLTCILAEWIVNCNPKYAPPTWRKLIIAVASRVGGDNPALARKIAMRQDDSRSTQEWINVDNRPIDSTEKQAVIDILVQVAIRWVAIGVLLGIPYDRLLMFEDEDDLERRVFKLAQAWLERNLGVSPTWRKLVEVIASKAGGDHQALAKRVANDHPVTEEQGFWGGEKSPLVTSVAQQLPAVQEQPLPPEVLRKDDIGFLMRELYPVVSKWQIFCVQLGIPTSELNIITAKPLLLAGAPKTFLQDALDYWICQANPTLKMLCEALKSEVVGESVLAAQIEAKFWEYQRC